MKKTCPEEGARNQIWAATGREVRIGVYYVSVSVKGRREKMGDNRELARELWEWTERELDAFDCRESCIEWNLCEVNKQGHVVLSRTM